MLPPDQLRNWERKDGEATFVCTTDPRQVDLQAVNAAFGSDMMWWAKSLPEEELKRMIEHSLCLSISMQTAGVANSQAPMIAFARVITDYTTFGYLTDVYVSSEYQGRGLGRWMMTCLDEVLSAWPLLRRFLILSGSPKAVSLYGDTLGATDLRKKETDLIYLERVGAAGVKHHTPSE